MTAVWRLHLSAFDKLVLLSLADIADDQGRCYPSIMTLAEKCGMVDRSVRRSIERLEGIGRLRREMRSGRSTVYHITPDTESPLTQSQSCQKVTPDSLSVTPDTESPPEKKKTSSLEPSLKRQLRKRALTSDEPPPPNLNVEAWHRWVEYRKQIRKPIQPASTLAAQRKLAAFGPDQSAVVEQSIADGYQGLFPLKRQLPRPAAERSEWR